MYIFNRITVNPQLPKRINQLLDIANNLWWSWNTEFLRLFKDIDSDLWDTVGKNRRAPRSPSPLSQSVPYYIGRRPPCQRLFPAAPGKQKGPSVGWSFPVWSKSANAVELQGHGALLVSGVVLVQNPLGDRLVNQLHSSLVSALGLGAIALCGSSLELLHGGLQGGFVGLVAGVANLSHQNALLSRLDIRQTKHLLQ